MKADGVEIAGWRGGEMLGSVEGEAVVAVSEPGEARFRALGGEIECAAVGGVWAGGGGGGPAEEAVEWPVGFLAGGAAVVDALAGAAALEGGGGVADGAEGWGGGSCGWGDG